MRSYYADYTVKDMYISGAPQCPIPDAFLNDAMVNSYIDFYFVQFYNNYCGIDQWSPTGSTNFNFDSWDSFAKSSSYNTDVKVYLGVPASSTAAGTGYVDIDTLTEAAAALMSAYSSFGGIMMWDASQAYNNIPESGLNYAQMAKAGLVSAGVAVDTTSSSSLASPSPTTITSEVSPTTLAATANDESGWSSIEEASTLSLATTSSQVGPTVVTISSVTLSSPIQTLVVDGTTGSSIVSSTSSLGPTATYPVVSVSPPPSAPTPSSTVDGADVVTEIISYTSTVYNTAFSSPVEIIFFSTVTSAVADISSPALLASSTTEATSSGTATSASSQTLASVDTVQPTVNSIGGTTTVSTEIVPPVLTVVDSSTGNGPESTSPKSTKEATSVGSSTVDSTVSDAAPPTSTFTVGTAATSTTSEAGPSSTSYAEGTTTNSAVAATSTTSTSITFITNPPWSATATTSSSTESATGSSTGSCPVDGAPCAVHGELACNGYSWGQCVWGTWIVRQCYTGLMCKTDASYVYCDYPGADAVTSCAAAATPGLTRRSSPATGVRLRRHAHMHGRRNHFHSPIYDPELGKKYFPHVPVKRQAEPYTATYSNLTLTTPLSATGAIATGQSYPTSTATDPVTSTPPVLQQVQFSASRGYVGSLTGTSAIPTATGDAASANLAVDYFVGFSIQQLNATNFVGTLSASPQINTPIGKSWMFTFTSPYVIDQVSRGELTALGDGSYQVQSIEIEEASSYMAVKLTFWGTYTGSGGSA
ncbi:hypothetical protein V1509DRAFT_272424 [Lipomyces kononenkoae]